MGEDGEGGRVGLGVKLEVRVFRWRGYLNVCQ